MQVVLHTPSASWAESARIALTAAGIEAIVLDQFSPGTLGLQGSLRVAVLNDGDVDRAQDVLQSLEPRKTAALPSWRWHKRALVSFVGAVLMLFMKMNLETSNAHRSVQWAVIALIIGLILCAVVFFILGSRADARLVKPNADD